MRKSVAGFVGSTLDAADVERARQTLRLSRQLTAEGMLNRARSLATRFDLYGEKSPGLGDDPTLLALTSADVEAALRDVLVPEALSVLTVVPGARGDYPAVLKESSGTAEPIVVAPRPVVDVPMLAAGEPGRAELPPLETATLSNGIKLVHYKTVGIAAELSSRLRSRAAAAAMSRARRG